MMKVIFSIFTLYQLSMANRLLQQFPATTTSAPLPPVQPLNPPPAQLPPQQPVPVIPPPPQQPAPVIPPPFQQTTTAAPVVPASPVTPGGPQPPFPGSPVTPQGPVPGQPVPGSPAAPVQPPPAPAAPVYPWQRPQPQGQTGTLFECLVSPPSPLSCAGKTNTIMNPMQGWELFCGGAPGSCYQSQINIGWMQSGPLVETISFAAASDYALAGATIYMLNYSGNQIYVDQLLCDKRYSCAGLTIVLGQDMVLEQGVVFCPEMGSCDGCTIKQSPTDVGEPCSKYAEPI